MERSAEYMEEYGLNMSKHLDRIYSLETVLGAGKQGIALLLKNRETDHLVVLKVLAKSKDILIKVQKLKQNLGIYQFAECYGMFVCDKFPENWQTKIDDILKEREESERNRYVREYSLQYDNIYYCYMYEYVGETLLQWLQKEHTYDDLVNIIVFVLFTLFDLFKRHKIVYTDPQLRNICIKNEPSHIWKKTFDYAGYRYLYNYNTNQTVSFIDFDSVIINIESYIQEKEWGEWNKTIQQKSWNFFHQCVFQLYHSVSPYLSEKERDALHVVNITRILMDTSFVDIIPLIISTHKNPSQKAEIRIPQQEPTKKKIKLLKCHICSSVATRALANRPSLTFCANDECVLKLGELVHMI